MDQYPSVFIDRDGTINVDAGYINNIDNFILYPFAAQAIRMLNMAGFLVVIVTNQSGIAKGYYDEDFLGRIHQLMCEKLEQKGALINKIYYCPHDPTGKILQYKLDCDCRKPKAGMLNKAIKELPINIKNMYFIGDKYSDIVCGWEVNALGILVETGYGKGEKEKILKTNIKKPDYYAKNLLEATKLIIEKQESKLQKSNS